MELSKAINEAQKLTHLFRKYEHAETVLKDAAAQEGRIEELKKEIGRLEKAIKDKKRSFQDVDASYASALKVHKERLDHLQTEYDDKKRDLAYDVVEVGKQGREDIRKVESEIVGLRRKYDKEDKELSDKISEKRAKLDGINANLKKLYSQFGPVGG